MRLSNSQNFHLTRASFWIHKVADRRAFPKFSALFRTLDKAEEIFCEHFATSWCWFSFFDTKWGPLSSAKNQQNQGLPKVMPVSSDTLLLPLSAHGPFCRPGFPKSRSEPHHRIGLERLPASGHQKTGTVCGHAYRSGGVWHWHSFDQMF